MKTLAVSLALLFAASVLSAQSAPAAKAPDAKPVDPKAAPAKPSAKKDDKKKEELPKIPGKEIARANGTFLGLEIVGGNFKLSFYDKKKKPMPIDVTRAMARWPNKKSAATGDNRTVLNGSGTFLLGAKPVVPPFVFNVYITLLQGEGDEVKAVESYVVPFSG